MNVIVTKSFSRRGEMQLPGSIIDVPDDMLSPLQGYVKPVPDHCRYWKQVCHSTLMYQEQCTGDQACRIFKFLDGVQRQQEVVS